jgi:Ca2+/Na+ antiporter
VFLIGIAVGCIGIMRNRKFPARKSSGRINVFAILQTAAFFIMGGTFIIKFELIICFVNN